MDAILEKLWTAGIPLFLLTVGIVWIATQWRADMLASAKQREEMIAALNALSERIDRLLTGKFNTG